MWQNRILRFLSRVSGTRFWRWIAKNREFSAWIPAAFWAFTVFVLSVSPKGVTPPVQIHHIDKVFHFSAYAFFAFLMLCGVKWSLRWPFMRYMAFALIFTSAYGILMEIFQGFIPSRHMSGVDVIFNTLGAFVGTVFGRLVLWRI